MPHRQQHEEKLQKTTEHVSVSPGSGQQSASSGRQSGMQAETVSHGVQTESVKGRPTPHDSRLTLPEIPLSPMSSSASQPEGVLLSLPTLPPQSAAPCLMLPLLFEMREDCLLPAARASPACHAKTILSWSSALDSPAKHIPAQMFVHPPVHMQREAPLLKDDVFERGKEDIHPVFNIHCSRSTHDGVLFHAQMPTSEFHEAHSLSSHTLLPGLINLMPTPPKHPAPVLHVNWQEGLLPSAASGLLMEEHVHAGARLVDRQTARTPPVSLARKRRRTFPRLEKHVLLQVCIGCARLAICDESISYGGS